MFVDMHFLIVLNESWQHYRYLIVDLFGLMQNLNKLLYITIVSKITIKASKGRL